MKNEFLKKFEYKILNHIEIKKNIQELRINL